VPALWRQRSDPAHVIERTLPGGAFAAQSGV